MVPTTSPNDSPRFPQPPPRSAWAAHSAGSPPADPHSTSQTKLLREPLFSRCRVQTQPRRRLLRVANVANAVSVSVLWEDGNSQNLR